jgi:uncharacterized protein (TIRG00374 family)
VTRSIPSQTGRTTWERHPADLARFLLASLICILAVWWSKRNPSAATNVSTDVVNLVSHLPPLVTRFLIGILQIAAIVTPVGALLYVRKGRWKELAVALGGAVAAGLIASAFDGFLRTIVPPSIIADAARPSWITGGAFPSGAYLAAVAAAVVIISPTLTRSWRRAAWWTVALVAFVRVLTAVEAPLNLLAIVSLGTAVGALVLLILGAPSRRPTPGSLVTALTVAGLAVDDLDAAPVVTHHGPAYVGTSCGSPVFVKVVGRDERDADLLARFVQLIRVKGAEDDRPLNPRLTVEREALSALMADRAGARVAGVRAVGETDERAAFVAIDRLDGTPLDELPVDEITDDIAVAAFHQLSLLHAARLAHRWASLEHLLVDAEGQVSMVDFRWAELGADDRLIASDLAEMLASFGARIGAERAVSAAAVEFDPQQLAAALPLMQPLAVSSDTKKALRHDKQLLPSLRDEVQRTAGVEQYEMVKLDRLTVRKVVSFFGLLVVANLLLGLVANWGDIWEVLKQVDLSNLPFMLLMVTISYATGAISLMGAVNVRLPFFRTTEIMFAQSFLNRFIPANAGGMALRARYLQKSGVDLLVAAASVGLTSAASGAMQVLFAITFFTWAGSKSEAASTFDIPSGKIVLVVVLIALVVFGIAYFTAFGRRVFDKTKVQIVHLLKEFRTLAKRPVKLLMLFGSAFFGKFVSVIMLQMALHAFGQHVNFPALGAMYITATTVAAAVPTPGGVGAIEAALTAGLIGLGVDGAAAAAVVLWFRLITYWLPVFPCWIAYQHVQRTDIA